MRRNKYIDILICIIFITGSVFFLIRFFMDLNITRLRNDKKPVGTVTYQKNTVQRLFDDRLGWDRLRKDSQVYNGDIVRTANLSEAIVSFDFGNSIHLSENTMIEISITRRKRGIDFSIGGMIVSTGANKDMIITMGDNRFHVEPETIMHVSSVQEDIYNISVNKGAVVLEKDRKKENSRIEAGSGIILNESGKILELTQADLIEEYIFVPSETNVFTELQDEILYTEREVRSEKTEVQTQVQQIVTVHAEEKPEAPGNDTVRNFLLPAPQNREPVNSLVITNELVRISNNIRFSWDAVQGANRYELTIYKYEGSQRKPVLGTPVILTDRRHLISVENIRLFSNEILYWQVEAIYKDNNIEQRGEKSEYRLIVDVSAPGLTR